MTVGERIRAARKAKGLTQKQLGEACGIAEPTIRRYELGKLNPKFETLEKIAVPLGISASNLLGIQPIPSEYASDIEFQAFNSYIAEMGYEVSLDWEALNRYEQAEKTHSLTNTDQKKWKLFLLTDCRNNKEYHFCSEELNALMDSINDYTLYQIHALLETAQEDKST